MTKIMVECCATCEQPKSRTNVPGQEVRRGWPVCINPNCIAFGEGVASAVYRESKPLPFDEPLRWRLRRWFAAFQRLLRRRASGGER